MQLIARDLSPKDLQIVSFHPGAVLHRQLEIMGMTIALFLGMTVSVFDPILELRR